MPDLCARIDEPHSVGAQRRAEWWQEHPPACRRCGGPTIPDPRASSMNELAFRCLDMWCFLHTWIDPYEKPEKEADDAE